MAVFSTYLENALLNATLRNTSYTSPTTVYLALYTSNPTASDVGTEVSGGSYARQTIVFSGASGGTITTSTTTTFPTATADWGTITHWGIRDNSTGGNLLYYGAFTPSKSVLNGDTVSVSSGQLSITLT